MLTRIVYGDGRQFSSVIVAIHHECDALYVTCMLTLIDGMRRRLLNVVDMKGSQISY